MVAVHELSWEEVSAPDFGARAAWRQAVGLWAAWPRAGSQSAVYFARANLLIDQ